MKALVAHPGTQHSGKLAYQLYRLGMLDGLHTGFVIAEGSLVDRAISALPSSWSGRVSNRRVAVPQSLIHLYPWHEANARWRQRQGHPQQRVLHERNERFQRGIPDSAFKSADAVIAFDTSSWILSTRAIDKGISFVLDQSIGHPDSKAQVYKMLREKYPDWSQDAEPRMQDVRAAEKIEHENARIIVVPSTFAKNTLVENGIPEGKIRINPFGVDGFRFSPKARPPSELTRFVFVGSMTVRKGIPQLLDVWRRLKAPASELWLIGPATTAVQTRIGGCENVVYKGAVPNRSLPTLLNQCDVFVFPTFFEGFAQVIPEAMACGLPVLSTTSAGADIIRNGENGWVISPGDDDSLLERLEYCIRSPQKVADAGRQAHASAQALSWERYGRQWATILDEVGRTKG